MSLTQAVQSSVFDARSGRYAFVIPRCGKEIAGGIETLIGKLAQQLHRRGNYVELWTTCARDNRTWENEYPAGIATEFEVMVRRFPVDPRDLEVWIPKQINISEGMNLALEDQLAWMAEGVNSQELYEHIALAADDFDAIFFGPYLFATTFWGALVRPDKSYLIPALHNESYAYTEVIQSLFRQVQGAIFNCQAEQEFAEQLYGNLAGGAVGMGFELREQAQIQQLPSYFEQDWPYLLYMGRKETGKNVQTLVDYFIELKNTQSDLAELKLVIAGGGSFRDVERPQALERDDIIDIGQVSEADKLRLMRHALVFCQPSLNESFSIVIMEAWDLGTPVLVHADCPVTREHVLISGGGLYFAGPEDFIGSVRKLSADKRLCTALATAGRRYVEQVYSWEAVLDRFDTVVESLLTS